MKTPLHEAVLLARLDPMQVIFLPRIDSWESILGLLLGAAIVLWFTRK